MNIFAIAPRQQKTVEMRCPECGDTFHIPNLPENNGLLVGSAWCIACNSVFRKIVGRRCWLEHQEHPPLVRPEVPVFVREVRHAS